MKLFIGLNYLRTRFNSRLWWIELWLWALKCHGQECKWLSGFAKMGFFWVAGFVEVLVCSLQTPTTSLLNLTQDLYCKLQKKRAWKLWIMEERQIDYMLSSLKLSFKWRQTKCDSKVQLIKSISDLQHSLLI